MKKLLSLFLVMALALTLAPFAFADGGDNSFALQEPALQIYSCIKEGYGAKNTEVLYDNEKIVISICIDGFSASFDEYSNSNGQKNKALMDSTKANFISLSQLFSAIVSNAGYPDAHVYLYLKDNLDEDNNKNSTILALLDGELKYDKIEDASSPAASPVATSAPVNVPSIGKLNAFARAMQYLDYTAFSYNGLIEQLEFEGYSHDEAVYGADNCGADWYKQAARKAVDYLDYTAFSYSGLIEQLEFEGYTHDEAVYGADNCGADWYEQAALKAADYLDFTAFSRSGLIEQLEYEGFTYDQAVFGVEQNGY